MPQIKVGICEVIERLKLLKGNIEGMSDNTSIANPKTHVDTLITHINTNGWLLNPTTSAITVSEAVFFHSGNTGSVGNFSVTGPKAYFSGSTWVFSGSADNYPNINYISAQISRLAAATTGSTQGGFTGTAQTFSSTTENWFTGYTRTAGTTSYTGVGFTIFVTGSTATTNKEGSDNHAVMSGTCSGLTTTWSATAVGFQQQLDEGRDRLRALSTQLTEIQSKKGIKYHLPQIKEDMIKEVDRISFILREGSNWGTFPYNCDGNEGLTASEKRSEKDFRKVGGVHLSAGDGPQRRG